MDLVIDILMGIGLVIFIYAVIAGTLALTVIISTWRDSR